jgi:hypothetical protein
MAHANIYIRKENETRWGLITDKSAWVNAMLEKSPPNSKVREQHLEPEPIEEHTYVPENSDPGAPKTGLESLGADKFQGPLFRNKKKGKL